MIKQPSFTLPINSKESWTRPESRSGWGEKTHLSIQARMVSHLLLHNRHQGAHAAGMGCVATAPQEHRACLAFLLPSALPPTSTRPCVWALWIHVTNSKYFFYPYNLTDPSTGSKHGDVYADNTGLTSVSETNSSNHFSGLGFVLFFKVSALLRTGLFLSLMVSYFSSYAFLRQSFFTFRAEQDFTATLLSFRLGSTQSFLTIITTEKLQPTQRGKHKFCYDSFIRLILINIPQQASIQCFSRTATGDVSAGSIFGCSKYLMGMQGFQCSFTR